MPKIIADRGGAIRKGILYRFVVPFEDKPAVEMPTPEWIVVPRTPTDEELQSRGMETWLYIDDRPDFDSCAETKDCPVDPTHVTFSRYTKIVGESFRGRISPIVAPANGLVDILSNELKQRIESLKPSGGRIDAMKVSDHYTDAPVKGFWALQFVGKARLKLPKFVDAANRCPHCGKTKIVCESCGNWMPYCVACKNDMVIIESQHQGKNDKRIPTEENIWCVIEGKTWDGSDLVQANGRNFASKRFIDWLLRIHAAPFYAEPVYFCVDGMSDQQKKWFDDLQKPFEI